MKENEVPCRANFYLVFYSSSSLLLGLTDLLKTVKITPNTTSLLSRLAASTWFGLGRESRTHPLFEQTASSFDNRTKTCSLSLFKYSRLLAISLPKLQRTASKLIHEIDNFPWNPPFLWSFFSCILCVYTSTVTIILSWFIHYSWKLRHSAISSSFLLVVACSLAL